MTAYLHRLLDHLGWADDSVLAALQKVRPPAPEWVELFAHTLGAEHIWLARLERRPATVAVWPTLSLDECAVLAADNHGSYREFLHRLVPADLARGIPYRNSAGQAFESTVEDILLHVFLHGTYHRGQVAAAMRRGGAVPAATDYIGFIRGAPAATRQRADE